MVGDCRLLLWCMMLTVARCMRLRFACRSLCVGCCLLVAVCCVLIVCWCLSVVGRRVLCAGAGCLLFVGRWSVVVVC